MPRLIWVFTGRTCHFVGFVMCLLTYRGYSLEVFIWRNKKYMDTHSYLELWMMFISFLMTHQPLRVICIIMELLYCLLHKSDWNLVYYQLRQKGTERKDRVKECLSSKIFHYILISEGIRKIFFLFVHDNIYVGTHKKHLCEALVMTSHNICLHREMCI